MSIVDKLEIMTLRESHRFLQSALDALTKQIAIVDGAGEIVAVNASFLRFARENGWARAEALEGANYLESWSGSGGSHDHLARVRAGLRSVQSGERGSFALEYSVHADSASRFFSLSIVGFEDRGRALLAIEHEDITSRKQLERQFHHSQKMEAIGQLAGGVAHDFNNLLTVIRSYGDLLLQEFPVGDQRRDDLQQILNATDAAGALTKQLLAFGRQQLLKLEVLDVNAVISELDKMLQRLIGENIEYVTALEHSASRVEADPGQIQQIMMNLVINARDAMPNGGKLTIETKDVVLDEPYSVSHNIAAGRYVLIEVTDTGSGMSPDVQARVFEPFFTTKDIGKGTGLGLSTVYGIVQQCHGQICVHSELGRGTTFKIYLPCIDAPVTTARISAGPAAMGSETVLVVEDNMAVRSVLCRVLKDAGYAVLSACDAMEAQTVCASHSQPIDLLLTDVVMPGLSGPDLATELVAQRPDMKVLFMSGYSGTAITRHGMLREGLVFLQKPFSPGSVTQAVRSVLGP